MPGPLEFEVRFPKPGSAPVPRKASEGPLRILVIGDFSGRSARGPGAELASRRIHAVDIDNFDQVMARLDPRLRLAGGAGEPDQELAFGELDDFHPDALYRNLPVFQELRQLRGRLRDPASFEDAAAELLRDAGQPAPEAGTGPPDAAPAAVPDAGDDTFERLLGDRPAALAKTGTPAREAGAVTRLIQKLIEPDLGPQADPDQQRLLVASVDDATAIKMREVLHHPAFQGLESAWRGLYWLVSSLETDEELGVHLLDVGRDELAADVAGAGSDPEATALFRALASQGGGFGGDPWSLVAGDFSFGGSTEDLTLLAFLGEVAARSGGPFLAGARPEILGCTNLAETPDARDWSEPDPALEDRWQTLRRAAPAGSIGLALPRCLLRIPYGRDSDPIDAFAFEEMPGGGDHEAFLWGNPAFACALLIGQAFVDGGWTMQPGDRLQLDDLPAHSFSVDGETQLKPCAEVNMSESTAEAVLRRGLMPFLSHRQRNVVRLVRFQSIADPPRPLAGPWA